MSALKIEAVHFSVVAVTTYEAAWCHNPEDYNLHGCYHLFLVRLLFHLYIRFIVSIDNFKNIIT